jgi:hypothetical protein
MSQSLCVSECCDAKVSKLCKNSLLTLRFGDAYKYKIWLAVQTKYDRIKICFIDILCIQCKYLPVFAGGLWLWEYPQPTDTLHPSLVAIDHGIVVGSQSLTSWPEETCAHTCWYSLLCTVYHTAVHLQIYCWIHILKNYVSLCVTLKWCQLKQMNKEIHSVIVIAWLFSK